MEIIVVTKEANENQVVLKNSETNVVAIPFPTEILVLSKTTEGFVFEPKAVKEIAVTVDI